MQHVPEEIKERAYAVGGVVRDALLGLPPGRDLDLVVEGELDLGPDWSAHDRFGTAIQVFPDGTLHVGATRTERYPAPGALPDVGPGTLDDDLSRRDVTVNAMAFPLFGPGEGELTDNHGGRDDLDARLMRIMRPDAFVEDPSRLVRVARYAARLGFTLETGTEAAARAAAPGLDLANSRVAGEFRRLLEEDGARQALTALADLGVPWIGDPSALAAIDEALAGPGPPDVPAWAARLAVAVVPSASERAALPGWAVATARELREGAEVARRLPGDAKRSVVDRALAALPHAGVLGALTTGAEAVRRWWEEDRDLRPLVTGRDLVAEGVPPGPAIGRALAAVRAAVLDGPIEHDRDAQLDFALRIARGEG
jgi:tRNA nucleotidyltransferase (CCA-adding enzyme)